jgi:hypothetical protein
MNSVLNNENVYSASFNVGNVEVWSSELYLDKSRVFEELEENMDEIACTISNFHLYYSDENPETFEMLKRAVRELKKNDFYEEKENDLDFFILKQTVWKDRTHHDPVNFNNYGAK